MTAIATFFHGAPLMVDHTPGSAVDAGDVVVVGLETRIAHSDIAANRVGALAAPAGAAVYKVPKATGGGTAITAGAKLWWDPAAERVSKTQVSPALRSLGISVAAAGDDDTTVLVRHVFFEG